MVSVAQLVVPGGGPLPQALSTAKEQCNSMKELQFVYRSLHTRLENLLGEVQLMECKGRPLSSHSLDQFTAVTADFLRFLDEHNGKDLVYRAIKHEAMAGALKGLDDTVSALFLDLLDVADVKEWENDRNALDAALTAAIKGVMHELQSPRAQLQALLTLKFESEKRAAQHGEKELSRMKLMMETIVTVARVTLNELPLWFVPDYDVKFESQPFARGSSASVHRGAWNSGAKTVVKRFEIDTMAIDSRAARKMETEMNLRFQMDHPNIIKVYGASHVSSQPFVVYEDATNGDLGSFLYTSENKQLMWNLLLQAAVELDYIHKQGVVHGHLKLSNILVGEEKQAMLSDFGLNTMRSISTATSSSSRDIRWRAPECLKQRPTFASDVYSFAMCMIEASIGEPPFAFLSDEDVRESLKQGEISEQPEEMDDEVWELVKSMTDVDPAKRIGLDRVIEALDKYARLSSAAPAHDVSARCGVCDALVFDRPRCCAQCGNRIFIKDQPSPTGSFDLPEPSESQSASIELSTDTSVSDLVEVLRTGSASEQEEALLLLLQASLRDRKRQQISDEGGISVLIDLVKNGRTHFTRRCAFGCLGWSSELDSSITDSELESLRSCVPGVTAPECTSRAFELRDDSVVDKLKTVIHCSFIAETNDSDMLLKAGVVPSGSAARA